MRVYGGAALGANIFTGSQTFADGSTWDTTGITLAAGKNIAGSSTSTSSGFASYVTLAAGAFYWITRAVLRSPADGVVNVLNNAENAGVRFDAATDGILKLRNRANNANAALEALTGTFTGLVTTVASASGGAGLNLPHGAAPSAPVNGDVWTTTAGLFVRINGGTVGPLS